MTEWNGGELATIGSASELTIAVKRSDGSHRRPVPIWVVRVGDGLFVRSWKGEHGAWYRHALEQREARISAGGIERAVRLVDTRADLRAAIDSAYRAKFGGGGYVDAMVTSIAAGATFEVVPEAES